MIDDAITELQRELIDLYERRKSILHPTATGTRRTSPHIDLEKLDLSLSTHMPLRVNKRSQH